MLCTNATHSSTRRTTPRRLCSVCLPACGLWPVRRRVRSSRCALLHSGLSRGDGDATRQSSSCGKPIVLSGLWAAAAAARLSVTAARRRRRRRHVRIPTR